MSVLLETEKLICNCDICGKLNGEAERITKFIRTPNVLVSSTYSILKNTRYY